MRSKGHAHRPPARRVLLLVLLALLPAVLIGCAAAFALSARSARRDSTRVLLAANHLERLVTDMETGQLRYVATGDDGLLGPWLAARAEFPRQAAILQRLAAENDPGQGRRAREIIRLTRSYLREHAEPFVSAARRDRTRARSVITRAEGKRRIEAIRGKFDHFTETQHRLALSRERDAVPTVRRVLATAVGASGSLLLILLLAGYRRYSRGLGAPDRPQTSGGPSADPPGERQDLRRLAALIAGDVPPDEVITTVADAMGRALRAEHAMITRYEADGTVAVLGHWSAEDAPEIMPPAGGRWPVEDETVTDLVYRTGRVSRLRADLPAVGAIGDWIRANRIRRMIGYPVVAGDRLWGMVSVLSRGSGSWPADAERTMGEYAGLLGIALVGARRRAELHASRIRLVEAGDAVRHRIERALHERTQQRLVTIGLELRAVEATVPPGMDRLRERLSGAAHGMVEIVDDLQTIARTLHPAFLVRSGLAVSLRALARRADVPVELDVRAERPLPQILAVTVYYLVSEALANAAAHAYASVVHVALDLTGPVLLTVRDDGVGGARLRPGSALSWLRERTEALGGRFELDSPSGGGTSLRVSLPLDDAPAGPL